MRRILAAAAVVCAGLFSGYWVWARSQTTTILTVQNPGNCTDPNVAVWLPMTDASGTLTVPTGCSAAGATFVPAGSGATPVVYSETAPPGLGTSILFSGNSYFAASSTATGDNTTNPMVIEAWFKTTASSTVQIIASKGTGWILGMLAGNGKVYLELNGAGATSCDAFTPVSYADGQWHHAVGTWNGSNATTIQVDNSATVTCSTAVGSITNANTMDIGARSTGAPRYWQGYITNVRLTIGNNTNTTGYNTGTRSLAFGKKAGNCTDPNVVYWESFDEAGGNLTVPAGCAAAGTMFVAHGAPVYQQLNSGAPTLLPMVPVPPGLGYAVFFGGNADYFQPTADVTSFDLGTNNAVWEGWVAPSGGGANRTIAAKFTSQGWLLDNITPGKPRIFISDGTHSCNAAWGSSINNGAWHYIYATWTFGTATCTMSVDGQTPVSATGVGMTSVVTTDIPTLGARSPGTVPYSGSMADFRLTIGNATNQLGAANAFPVRRVPLTVGRAAGSCANPFVSLYEAFEEISGNLTVPAGCGAAGATWMASGAPTYRVTGAPPGLGYAIRVNNTVAGPATDLFTNSSATAGDVSNQSFVVDMWFQRTSTGNATPVILSKNFDGTGTSPDGSWEIYLANGLGRPTFELDQYYGAGNTNLADCEARDSTHVANDTNWHQIHAVWQAGAQVCSVSLDGLPAATATPSGFSTTLTSLTNTRPVIYGSTDNKDFWFDGALADLQIAVGTSNSTLGYSTTAPLVRQKAATTIQQPGNCSDPNVAVWLSMDGPAGNGSLVVPANCGASGTTFTENGAPTFDVTSGVPAGLGQAISFNGTTDSFQSPSSVSSLNISAGTPAVFEAWVESTDSKSFMRVFGKRGAANGYYMDLGAGTGTPRFVVEDATTSAVATWGSSVLDGNFHYLRATWDGVSTVTISVDGQSPVSGSHSLSLGANTSPLAIGWAELVNCSTRCFDGQIADLRITIGNSTNNLGYNSGIRLQAH